jgi:transposase-like protein
MSKDTCSHEFSRGAVRDALTEILREGARELLYQAVQAELEAFLAGYSSVCLLDGRKAVVRNGSLPPRTIQTGIGGIEVRVPKVRDRSGGGAKFNSSLVPPYLKKTKSMEEFLPWLYLKGISTGDYQEVLGAILGQGAGGLSAKTISRLKSKWQDEYKIWNQRDLSGKKYVYWWADGIYSNVRMDDRLCLLVIIGATADGRKELVAVESGYRESTDSWRIVMKDLRGRGLACGPKLAIGDGALGFWKALSMEFSDTRHQRCWVHKTANVLNKLPKSMHDMVKSSLHEIWMAESRDSAEKAFDLTLSKFGVKYSSAMECLSKDREALLTFYDFPAEHWIHIRTSNPIESAFSSIRLRTAKMRSCGSRTTTLTMLFKLAQSAEKRWRRLRGYGQLGEILSGVKFKDGIRVTGLSSRSAA